MYVEKTIISDQFARLSGLENFNLNKRYEANENSKFTSAEQDDSDTSLHEKRHELGTLAYWVYFR